MDRGSPTMAAVDERLSLTQDGDLVLLVEGDAKRFLIRLSSEARLQTHRGILLHRDLIGVL